MKISRASVKKLNPCSEGFEWFCKSECKTVKTTIDKLFAENHHEWGNWLITRLLSPDQNVQYAIYAAKLVLHLFESKYPNDDRPRKAIEAAETYLKVKTRAAARAARAAARAARAAGDAAWDAARAAWDAARAAGDAAWAAGDAAWAAAWAASGDVAWAAARAAWSAAWAAARAAGDAAKEQIVRYGLSLLDVSVK